MLALFVPMVAMAEEPILPIPLKVPYDRVKAKLGKILFFDPKISSDGTVSCHSCHDFNHGGADPRPVSIGVHGKRGNANAPTVFNSYFNFRQFWNGRAKDLKDQANGPIHNPVEMDMVPAEIEKYLLSNDLYADSFQKIYKRPPRYDDMLDAIAEFEKALYTPNCKFDRYLRKEKGARLTDHEARGYRLFKTLGCVTCHNGINVGGNSFQKFGLIIPYRWSEKFPDRYDITHDPKDKNVYKVPTLRNIALTAPYFHDGSAPTLKKALQKMAYHNLGFELSKKEIDAIEAFLRTLTGEKPAILREGD
ncbi:cytochrome-c peroxidase [Hydrogenimonas urashimensis]|uniref:cytochrome-c peroxidase n=1 Tax=Hydrogenimonas urashimensis TaxID=2740515 RepID=UPI001F3F0E6E|nr:cytochrome-c peroxidase [Hydrogenimonas urashimensis]